jgi:hypothetical protein
MAELLGCTKVFKVADALFELRYESEKAKHFLSILNANVTELTSPEIRSRVLTCEYSVWMFVMFVSRFLNSSCIIKLKNEGKRIQGKGDKNG